MPSDMSTSREIRVFLSSTFRDMEGERDYLMKSVFPEIRQICAERQVSFAEIDLRWGITEEESKQGHTVEICLDEINRCRKHPPFFIGFLGERYGWIPQQYDLAGWLNDNNDSPYAKEIHDALAQGISLTELEMQFAFLNEQQPADYSRIFLRAAEKTHQLAQKAANPDDFYDAANGKLAALKDKLRASSCIAIDGYNSINEFGEAVKQYLIAAIDRLYPQDTLLSAAEMQTRAHSNYAVSRRKAYVPLIETRAKVLNDIKTGLASEDVEQKIAITGLSGRGKSAFLADLEKHLVDSGSGWVFSHYTEADSNRSLTGLRSRLTDALKAKGKLTSDISAPRNGLWEAITLALLLVQGRLKTPIYLLIDAVNQFNDAEAFNALSQLRLPENVILIATTTEPVKDNNWLVHELPALSFQNRQDAIERFLLNFTMDLPKELIQTIVQHKLTAEPLFLRLLLEGLSLDTNYERLACVAQQFLDTQDASELLVSVLTKLDQIHQHNNHSELASRAVSLLAAARRGLSYEELAKLLANDKAPKDPADNKPALADFILNSLLTRLEAFFLRDDQGMYIIQAPLLALAESNSEFLVNSRLQLIDYFAQSTGRAFAERIHQCTALNDTEKLVQTLGDLDGCLALWDYDSLYLRTTLSTLGAGLSKQTKAVEEIITSWSEKIKQYKALPKAADEFGRWLLNNAYYFSSEVYLEELLNWRKQSSGADQLGFAISLNKLAVLYRLLNRWDEAEQLLLQALEIRQAALAAGHPDIATSLNNLAELYRAQYRLDEAKSLNQQALEIRQGALSADHLDIAKSLNNIAELYLLENNLNQVEEHYGQALGILQAALPAGHPDIATPITGYAMLGLSQGSWGEEECLDALEIRQAALPAGHPDIAISLGNLANVYRLQNRLDEAETLYLQALEIIQAALPAGHPDIAVSLGNLADVYRLQNRLDEAESLFLQAQEINQAALPENHPNIANSLSDLGGLYMSQNRLDEAEEMYLQALRINEEVLPEDSLAIAVSFNNVAELYLAKNNPDDAQHFLEQALWRSEELLPAAPMLYASILNNQGVLYHLEYNKYDDYGKLEDAEYEFMKALEIRQRQLPEGHPDIAASLFNQAVLYEDLDFLDKAESFYLQALKIRKTALPANHPHIAISLSALGSLYELQNRLDEAEPLYLQALEIRQAGLPAGHPDIAISLTLLGELCKSQNLLVEAEPLLSQALEFRQAALPEDHPDIASSLNSLGELYTAQSRLNEAELLLLKALEIRQAVLSDDDPNLVISLENLAFVYKIQNRLDEAELFYLQALEIYQMALPAKYPDIKASLSKLLAVYKLQISLDER